ncbi:MAG: efflux RND transporter periplasmic adaptor subunit [Spirochaetes bacterium]|nr:efflux RND transporter periplasmic adaptor subunit [Spirochaetota bacterium]MBU1078880.1 efflux RND transporter periplasmic adaptor subunit [Spirochaetota bacterium]
MTSLADRFTSAAACLAALAFFACAREPAVSGTETRKVRAAVVEAALWPDEVSGFGSLSFLKKVDVASPQEAVVAALPYREGDAVSAGDIVARLSNPQLELALGRAMNGVAQAEAAVALAEARLFEGRLAAEARILGIGKARLEYGQAARELAELERKLVDQEKLFSAGGVTAEAVRSGSFSVESAKERLSLLAKDLEIRLVGLRDADLSARGKVPPLDRVDREAALVSLLTETLSAERLAASARLDAARKELESARIALSELSVAAPSPGVIGARYLEAGERAKREDKLVTIIDFRSLYAVVSVGEADATRLSRGMKAAVSVDSADARYDGVVDLVSPVADPRSASFSVRVAFDDPEGRLRPGMFARAVISAGEPRRVVVVPEGALVDRSGDTAKVFTVSSGLVGRRKVTLGPSLGSGLIVVSGLDEGDIVALEPDPGLKEGERAEVFD